MFLVLCHLSLAGEKQIEVSALPAAVTTAVQTRIPGAVIVGAAIEGKEYEAEITIGERRVDLAFKADGSWLEEEEVVASDTLPDAIKTVLSARWKGWTVERAERAITPKGTTFEVKIEHGEQNAEVVFSETGAVKRVEQEEEDEDEEGEH